MNHIVSFSGGRTSAFLCSLIKQKHQDATFVFMDTGAEHPKTYEFIKKCNDYFDLNLVCLRVVVNNERGVGVTYEEISIDDIGYNLIAWERILKKYSTPYMGGAFCTRAMKTDQFNKYARDLFGKNYNVWLGIRIDETKRLRQRDGVSYLADISDFTKQDVLDYWAKMPFDLEIKEHLGNCVFCIKKSINKIALAAKDEPAMAQDFIKLIESDNVAIIKSREHKNDKMYRKYLSLKNIIKMYEDVPRDVLAKSIRSTFETGSCTESCEIFSDQLELF